MQRANKTMDISNASHIDFLTLHQISYYLFLSWKEPLLWAAAMGNTNGKSITKLKLNVGSRSFKYNY